MSKMNEVLAAPPTEVSQEAVEQDYKRKIYKGEESRHSNGAIS